MVGVRIVAMSVDEAMSALTVYMQKEVTVIPKIMLAQIPVGENESGDCSCFLSLDEIRCETFQYSLPPAELPLP